MDEQGIEDAVREAIAELGAKKLKDMGRVMGLLKERYAGQIDLAKAGKFVKQHFG
jgi:hypothetical protein